MAKRVAQSATEHYVFGVHAVMALLTHKPEQVLEIHLQPGRDTQHLQQLRQLADQAGLTVLSVKDTRLNKMAPAAVHQGVIARIKPSQAIQEAAIPQLIEQAGQAALFLVLDGVQDPHNLGACLRTANAAGVTAVIAPRDRAVGITPVVRKTASGAAELTPFIPVTNLARCLRQLQQLGVWVAGLEQHATTSLYDHRFNGPVAMVLGNEGSGLRRLTREHCDACLSIPMWGQIESLNVSVASALCLYEVCRQRGSED